MGRKRRVWSPDHFYHIVMRGNRRDPLFQDEEDVKAFMRILNEVHEKTPIEIASYCLMTNHYHLLLRTKHTHISKVMSFINTNYARYYNARYRLSGHVFEGRFYDDIIYGILSSLRVSFYIHLNPVRARMVTSAELYPFSSYSFYLDPSLEPPPFFNPSSLLNVYPGNPQERKFHYLADLNEYQLNGKIDNKSLLKYEY
jgi:putative transposase